jgi:transcriptional regulator with XRE-family HTH domain
MNTVVVDFAGPMFNPVDRRVGRNIRRRRSALGLSRGSVATLLGVTAPQLQAYEDGATRISAAMLAEMCRVLMVPVAYVFVGLIEPGGQP